MNVSSQRKIRTCLSCQQSLMVTAHELIQHSITCKRMTKLGLQMATVVAPGQKFIITPGE